MTGFAGALESLLGTLDRLEIPFLIGGSIASSAYGLARLTNDVDILALLTVDSARELCEQAAAEFYCDGEAALAALARHRPFNLIHRASLTKADIFPAATAFEQSEIRRRRFVSTATIGLDGIEFPVASAEDIVLAKLVWFDKGGRVSDRQWLDILGLLHTQAGRLDREYLEMWSSDLAVGELLAKAEGEIEK